MNNKITLQAQKENSILIWNDRVGQRERQKLGHEVESMYNPKQVELLREYKSQFPSGYNRYDPTTGQIIVDQNTGNPVTYKYQPPNYNITLDAPNLQAEFTQQEITQRENAINQYLLVIATREKDIIDIDNNIKNYLQLIDQSTIPKDKASYVISKKLLNKKN